MPLAIVMLVISLLPPGPPLTGAGERPKPTIVTSAEFAEANERIGGRFETLRQDAAYLEAQLAKKKAELQAAEADLTIYNLTHAIDPKEIQEAPDQSAPVVGVPAGNPGLGLVELPLTPNAPAKPEVARTSLKGRLLDSDGKPIRGASVTLDMGDDGKPHTVETDAEATTPLLTRNPCSSPRSATKPPVMHGES